MLVLVIIGIIKVILSFPSTANNNQQGTIVISNDSSRIQIDSSGMKISVKSVLCLSEQRYGICNDMTHQRLSFDEVDKVSATYLDSLKNENVLQYEDYKDKPMLVKGVVRHVRRNHREMIEVSLKGGADFYLRDTKRNMEIAKQFSEGSIAYGYVVGMYGSIYPQFGNVILIEDVDKSNYSKHAKTTGKWD
ncbi:MAG: hypothetical protein ACRCRT_04000 [Cetobacterium somerae]